MKNKKDYSAFEWKMFSRIVMLAVGAFILVIIFRYVFRGSIGDAIVGILESFPGITRDTAFSIYTYNIRPNINYIIFGAAIVTFIIMTRFLMSYFARYFDEISNGLDTLVEDEDGEILLSPEMNSMERKLNAIRQTLHKRRQDAKEAEQRKNELVTYLAHDIKTPLTSVIGYLSLMDELPDMPVKQRGEYVRITLDKASRLERLIEEFFEITKFNMQTMALNKEQIDLYYMLVQMTDEFYPVLSAKGIEAVLDAPEDLTVYGDSDKLARVFNNIIKNAAEYGPENGTINISAASSGDGGVTIKFKNAGSIPQKYLASIFDKFYRLDSSRGTASGGAGLGLAIAKEIVAGHGGRIYAESDGGFITFTVELPGEEG